jgi:predicted kinase
MPATGTLHLISGLPCAGKTTYAERLKSERDAVYLSLDRWLFTAYGRYPIDVVGYVEHGRRVYACRELMWSVAAQFLSRGADVILDDGFFLSYDRRHYVASARAIGAGAVIHFIDAPADVLRARLAARNLDPGEYSFEIAPDALDGFISFYERPSEDEGADLVVVSGASGRSE